MVRLSKSLAALALALAGGLAAPMANAACQGMNLFDLMTGAKRDGIAALADAVPFPRGNYWQAEKEGRKLTLVGTYHLDDPRHSAVVDWIAPEVAAASALLVEAGPEEEKALKERVGKDTSLLVITEGPALNQLLAPEIWERLAEAGRARGMPPFMLAKFRPWYVTVLLAVPPCAMESMTVPNGLDQRLIKVATDGAVPVKALEPYDTVFSIFDTMSEADQLGMIEQTLAMEDSIVDFSETLADMYFDGDSRLMWELMREISYSAPGYTRERVDAEMAVLEEALMNKRNRAWIPVIEEASQEGPLVVAFGALHLAGEEGVLNLLHKAGWTVTPLAGPQ